MLQFNIYACVIKWPPLPYDGGIKARQTVGEGDGADAHKRMRRQIRHVAASGNVYDGISYVFPLAAFLAFDGLKGGEKMDFNKRRHPCWALWPFRDVPRHTELA